MSPRTISAIMRTFAGMSTVLIQELRKAYEAVTEPTRAPAMEAYMKHIAPFMGVSSQNRRLAQKEWMAQYKEKIQQAMPGLVRELWQQPEREFQYTAQELLFKHVRKHPEGMLPLIEYLITHKSWWDTVDFIAARIAGAYFKHFPEEIPVKTRQWMDSGNLWLQRSVLLFQLFYKDKTNTTLLENSIRELAGHKDFFIRKAIGWSLRQYARTHADWVRNLVQEVPLSGLSYREAMKHL